MSGGKNAIQIKLSILQSSYSSLQYQNLKKETQQSQFQIDLVDMSSKLGCDGNFRYIAHYVDHFTKYHVIWPMEKKDAAELARGYKFSPLRIIVRSHLCTSISVILCPVVAAH